MALCPRENHLAVKTRTPVQMLTSGSMNSYTRNCLIHLCVTISLILAGVYCMPGLYGLGRRLLTTMAAEYKAGTHSVVFVTVPNAEVGKTLARGLVEKKLAACVNLIPGLISMYEWEGKIEEDSEMLMKIKTRSSRVNDISEYIRQHHPYDVAEVISVPIENGNPPYLEWLGKNVPEK